MIDLEKIQKNKSKFFVTVFLSVLAALLLTISVGFSALNQDLNIAGDIDYEGSSNSLYNVLKKEADIGTYAKQYTGEHQDSMSGNGDKKIYHWYAPNNSESSTAAATINEKNNVFFNNHCWKLLRTTDVGGVKLLYNGKEDSGKCLNSRGNHVGYTSYTAMDLRGEYYYASDFYYDQETSKFSLTGSKTLETFNEENFPNLIGKYTCKSNNENATCSTLYQVAEYYSDTSTIVLKLGSTVQYSLMGKAPYNSDFAMEKVGYMYPDHKYTTFTYNSFNKETVLGRDRTYDGVNTYYYYGDDVTWDNTSNVYRLVNSQSINPYENWQGLEGKYSNLSTLSTPRSNIKYIVKSLRDYTYYILLENGQMLNDTIKTYYFADSYQTDGSGNHILDSNSLTSIKNTEWYDNYSSVLDKYTCLNSQTCETIYKVTETTVYTFNYVEIDKNIVYSKSVQYDGNKYTLTGDKTSFWDWRSNYNTLSNYHYTCFTEDEECETVNFIYRTSKASAAVVKLENGKKIEDLTNEYFVNNDINKNESIAKIAIESWYKRELYSAERFIDDVIYCNNRTITSNSFTENGIITSNSAMSFFSKNWKKRLECQNTTDKFSVSNNYAKLKYPIGLPTVQEFAISGYEWMFIQEEAFWTMSPSELYQIDPFVFHIYKSQGISENNVSFSDGLRPVIALKPEVEYVSGTGTTEDPYVIDTVN